MKSPKFVKGPRHSMRKPSKIHALYRNIFLCFAAFMFASIASASSRVDSRIGEPIFFLNQGQWPEQVLAKAPLIVGDLWITQQGFVFNFLDTSATELVHDRSTAVNRVKTHAVFLNFVNPNKGLRCESIGDASETYYNFYKGRKFKSVSGVRLAWR